MNRNPDLILLAAALAAATTVKEKVPGARRSGIAAWHQGLAPTPKGYHHEPGSMTLRRDDPKPKGSKKARRAARRRSEAISRGEEA